ncbi:MAG: hypothetical protein M3203_01500, partial [Actinomycetota bacterium]|nr:hypothetical protein [Actinomycetota bacterium]
MPEPFEDDAHAPTDDFDADTVLALPPDLFETETDGPAPAPELALGDALDEPAAAEPPGDPSPFVLDDLFPDTTEGGDPLDAEGPGAVTAAPAPVPAGRGEDNPLVLGDLFATKVPAGSPPAPGPRLAPARPSARRPR